jgi:HEAT repeat protein
MAAIAVSNDPSAAVLFRQFAATTSFELVQLAVLGLGVMRDVKAIQILQGALGAPSLSVKRAACMALVAIGTVDALEIVARTLLNGEEEVRRAAAEALANDSGEGHAMLRDGLTMADIVLRQSVAYGLGRVNEPWAIEALKKLQVDDDQWIVRNAATEVLDADRDIANRAPHKLASPSEIPWLIEFAGKQGVGISPGASATDILLLALKGDDPDTRLAALPYLKNTPSEGVITQLYAAMFKDDPELREYAYYALWEMGISGVKLPNPSQYGFG